jgi:hypothetical protein
MGDLALGIDCSSTAAKVVAWDRNGLAGVGDMFVTSTGGRNIRVGRLLGGGLLVSDARARMGDITLEGAAAIQVIGGALPKLTDRDVIGAAADPLWAVKVSADARRHLKALLVTAPERLQARLRRGTWVRQAQACAALVAAATDPVEHRATVRALRLTAERALAAHQEARALAKELGPWSRRWHRR